MTKDEIIEMARQAGFSEWAVKTPNDLINFAKLVAAKYEDEIQDLKDMIMELLERQE